MFTSLQPVCSLNRPRRPFLVGVLQPMSLPPSSAPTATGWSDSCRAGFAPAEEWRLARRTRSLSLVVLDSGLHLWGGTPHHFASSIFVFFLVRDRLFRSTDPGAWHTRHRHWDVEWVEGRSADDGMSPKALASLGSRSPRTVSHGRQPALRVLRCAPVLRMTAATDRARSPCGPAGKAGPRSTACKCDACEPLRCRGTPSTTPGRDPRVPSRLRAAAMGHPDTKATGRGAGLT